MRNKKGLPIYYVNRRLYEPSLLKYLKPKIAIEGLREKGLLYDRTTQTGTLLHILGALKSCGFVEITSIAKSREQAFEIDRLVQRSLLNKARTLKESELLKANLDSYLFSQAR